MERKIKSSSFRRDRGGLHSKGLGVWQEVVIARGG